MNQDQGRPNTIGHKLDQKMETVRKNYRTVQQDSAKQMKELKEQTLSKRHIVKKSRKQFRASKAKVKSLNKAYKSLQKQGKSLTPEGAKKLASLKKELDKAKLEKRVSKKVFKVAQEANGGSRKKKFYRATKQALERSASQQASSAAHQDDTLSDIARAKYRYQDIQIQGKRIKTIGKYSGKLGQGMVKSSYRLGNRVYNKAKGRGFH